MSKRLLLSTILIVSILTFSKCFFIQTQNQSNDLCDSQLTLVSSAMGNFNSAAYKPPIIIKLFDRLNNLRATILATYQLCFNHPIVDPDSMYPQDKSQCLMGLYNCSQLQAQYTNQPGKIYKDFANVSKIVISTQNNCRPILYAVFNQTFDDTCKSQIDNLHNDTMAYLSDIYSGGNGTRFINNLVSDVERVRKLCDYSILTKPKGWTKDTCKMANMEWLYPIADQFDTIMTKKDYKNFANYFYFYYQTIYRAQNVCILNPKQENTINQQKINAS